MAWIVGIIIVIVLIAAISKSNKKPSEKYFKYSDSIIKSETERRERIAKGEHDDMYFAWEQYHQGKSLEQIQQYIKSRREENWDYWQNNRLEYKVLMDISRTLEAEDKERIKQIVESEQINQLGYDKLLEYYRMVKYNPHIYEGINDNLLITALENASFDKFYPELISKTPATSTKWLKARSNEGEYIASKLNEIASEMEQKESPEEAYKRQRKNIQSNISKAKKDGDTNKIIEFEQKLIELENQKTKN